MTRRLIYLHGFASSPQSKKAQYFAAKLAGLGVDVEIPDLAEGNFEGLTISGQLRVVEKAAGVGPVTLMGSSLGGWLAALYAARHAEVDRLVLLAPGFGFPQRWPVSLGAAKMAEWERTGYLEMFHYGEKREQRVSFELIRDGRRYEEYPEVRQPCLIYHGRKDDVVPAAWSEEFAAQRPNVDLRVVDSDHELIDVLETMWDGVRAFLAG